MLLKPFLRLLRQGRLKPLITVGTGLKPFYQLTWLAAAAEAGILHQLAAGPVSLESFSDFTAAGGQSREALEAWLQMGVRLRLLRLGARGYDLRGLAQALAQPENDSVLALTEEVAGLHHKLIAATLPKLRSGDLWTLADQDGELIARSSRIFEPFQADVIRRTFPEQGPLRLLEIGCGSGIYLRYAAAGNSALTALGLELQPTVAEIARTNIRTWGLQDRVSIEDGDIRLFGGHEQYGCVVLGYLDRAGRGEFLRS